ncbi:hypothetical protein B0H19DRAFT_1079626 [Mycena capillaripes]|nr:hypothetical protein B0H19DRAFT_1079626 [Mycena capillaripes]
MPGLFRASDCHKPSPAGTCENGIMTDTFHLNVILTPAIRITAAIRNEQTLAAGSAASQNSTKGDLMVFTLSTADDIRPPWLAVEDKRLAVFMDSKQSRGQMEDRKILGVWYSNPQLEDTSGPGEVLESLRQPPETTRWLIRHAVAGGCG